MCKGQSQYFIKKYECVYNDHIEIRGPDLTFPLQLIELKIKVN